MGFNFTAEVAEHAESALGWVDGRSGPSKKPLTSIYMRAISNGRSADFEAAGQVAAKIVDAPLTAPHRIARIFF